MWQHPAALRRRTFLAAAAAAALPGCKPQPASAPAQAGPLPLAATTAMVADLARRVGGDLVRISNLMGPGVDPHLYKATAEDLVKLQQAAIIFHSGLHLEGRMQDVFDQLKRGGRAVHAVTEALPAARLLKPTAFEGHFDPHVWFDVDLWSGCLGTVAGAITRARPDRAGVVADNASAARAALAALHQWALARAAELPAERRILITSHDAFNYFGRAYGFRVVALQGVSTVTEAGLADVSKLVDFIKAHRVPAIFVESSVPHAMLERISRDAGVKIGGELFSDAMGTPGQLEDGQDLGTYEGMIRHNMNTIVNALR